MLQSLASLVLLPVLSYKLGVPDTTIGVVASFSKILGLIGIGTSWLLSADSTFFILGQTEYLLHKLSNSKHLLVRLRVWDDGTPGFHRHLVSTFQDGAGG